MTVARSEVVIDGVGLIQNRLAQSELNLSAPAAVNHMRQLHSCLCWINDRKKPARIIEQPTNEQAKILRTFNHLMRHDIGILSGTTAFGKTIVAIKLIAEKKENSLILVDKVSLLSQWKEKLSEFLIVNEPLPVHTAVAVKKRGRKKKVNLVGQLGSGKNSSSGIVDIAVMQSLSRKGEVKESVKNYGMIIADECHHVSAFT